MIDDLIAQLVSHISGTLVYVAIALVTLVGILKCIYPVFRNSALLNHAITKLERSAGAGERPAWREARFLGQALRPDWQRFLLNAGQLDMRGIPCDTQEYINEDTVIYRPGHAQLAELIPSLLTSLGILGTFMGLMSGLSNLDLTDASKTIASIPTLLNGMEFAFATSVAGIVCSLTFNMINRIAVGRAFKALDAFDEAFYELAMPRPLDAEVQMICQKQDDEANLQRAADQIGSQMAGAVEMAVSRAVHPLTMSLDNFIQGTSRDQAEGMQRVANQFIKQMNLSMNGQLTALADTLSLLNQNQAKTHQNLQRTLAIAESLVDDMKRTQMNANRLPAGTDPEAQRRQNELLNLLKQTAEQQATAATELRKAQAEMLQALRETEERLKRETTVAESAALAEELRRTRKAIEALSDNSEKPALRDVTVKRPATGSAGEA